ncbi:hypothetical protein Dimus_000660 [Dionaea muscipula]
MEKGERKKSDQENVRLTSTLDGPRLIQTDQQESFDSKTKENFELQTELNEACLKLVQEYDVDLKKFVKEWGEEIGGSSAIPEPIAVVHPTELSHIPSTSDMDTP